jgi:ATP:corrinoid adenosyltransferase
LKKAIKEEKWDSAVLDEIKKFVEIETVKSVRLLKSKRED